MEAEAGLDSSSYLQNHLETGTQKSEDQLEAFAKPLHNYPVGAEQYRVLPESGKTTLGSFDYGVQLDEIDPQEFFLDQEISIAKMMNASPEGPTDEQTQKIMYSFLLGEYNSKDNERPRILKKFDITNNELNQSISVTDMLPEGYKIVYKPKPEENIVMDAKGKNIFIDGNILSLKTVVDLLHEIGHAVILKSLKDNESTEAIEAHKKFTDVLIEGGEISDETLAIFLRNERDAWAFALKEIRKILGRSGKLSGNPTIIDDVYEYIRQNVLKQNSDQIRRMRDPNFKGLFREALEKKMEGNGT